MRLYHYTAAHMVEGIRRDGITLGMMPVWRHDEISLVPGYQWMTDEDTWEQPWNVQERIKYDRAACRVVVSVPKSNRMRLVRWRDMARAMPPEAVSALNMNGAVDDSHWWLYVGRLSPAWLRTWEKRPQATQEPAPIAAAGPSWPGVVG